MTVISRAMQVLKECSVLKIEEILPFFSDVVTIDQFKVRHLTPHSFILPSSISLSLSPSLHLSQDAICDSLQTYNSHIDLLKKEMQGATESAKNIRSDIQEIKNK